MKDDEFQKTTEVIHSLNADEVFDEDKLFLISYTGRAGVVARSANEASKRFQEGDILGKAEIQEVHLADEDPEFHKGHNHHNHSNDELDPSLFQMGPPTNSASKDRMN